MFNLYHNINISLFPLQFGGRVEILVIYEEMHIVIL